MIEVDDRVLGQPAPGQRGDGSNRPQLAEAKHFGIRRSESDHVAVNQTHSDAPHAEPMVIHGRVRRLADVEPREQGAHADVGVLGGAETGSASQLFIESAQSH